MSILTEYPLDKTGKELSNLIENEIHTEIDSFVKLIIPKFGSFYTEGLIVKDNNDNVLNLSVDYVNVEFNQKLSLLYGKEICTSILIINKDVQTPIKITYQAVGGDKSVNRNEVLQRYELLLDRAYPDLYWNEIIDKPIEFKSEHHLHDINEIYGFEYITIALNRIKNAIDIGCFPSYQSLLSYIDAILLKLASNMSKYLDDNMNAAFLKFKEQFNKAYFDLDKLENLSAATELDGKNAGQRSFKQEDLVANKYMTLEALVGLKDTLYKSFVTMSSTNLGYSNAQYDLPEFKTVFNLNNCETISVISQEKAREERILNDDIYPKQISESDELVIKKLSNKIDNMQGNLLGVNINSRDLFLGSIRELKGKLNVGWTRHIPVEDLESLNKIIQGHITDYGIPLGDPHEINKKQIELDLVENLAVVDKEDILALKSIHKYVTFDTLLYFMRAFLLQNGKVQPIPAESNNKFIIDNAVVVFTPAGVACEVDCSTPAPTILQYRKISQYCKAYEEDTAYPRKDLIGVYKDSADVEFEQVIKEYSYCCSFRIGEPYVEPNDSSYTYKNVRLSITGYGYLVLTCTYTTGLVTKASFRLRPQDEEYNISMEHYNPIIDNGQVGTVILEITQDKYYKQSNIHSYDVTTDDEYEVTDFPANILLFIDRPVIKTGETAQCEITILSNGTEYYDPGQLIVELIRKDTDEVIPIPGFPKNLPKLNSALDGPGNYEERINFELPFIPELHQIELGVRVSFYNDSENLEVLEGSNTFVIDMIPQDLMEITIPHYRNNVQVGNLTLSHDNETGLVAMTGYDFIISANDRINTSIVDDFGSDVFYFHNSLTTKNNSFVMLIDTWLEIEDSDTVTSTAIITREEFESIKKVISVPWNDEAFDCVQLEY